MKELLLEAKNEIERLRRQNEVLGAQVEVMNLFRATLYSHPPHLGMGAVEDVAWKLQRAAEEVVQPTPRCASDITAEIVAARIFANLPALVCGDYTLQNLLNAACVVQPLPAKEGSRLGRILRNASGNFYEGRRFSVGRRARHTIYRMEAAK